MKNDCQRVMPAKSYAAAPGGKIIMRGRPNGLPSFANALPEDAIRRLVTPVRTLCRTATEPLSQPPETLQTGKP
jgi:hypothetical protein